MQLKVGYYPMLDTALALRQIFSVERFKPYCPSLASVDSRLTDEEKKAIDLIAPLTQEWLDVMQNMIDMTMQGVVSPEEMLIKASKDPKSLFGASGQSHMVKLLSDIWYNYCFTEISKHVKKVSEKAAEISCMESKEEIMDYVLGLSDRIEKTENNIIKFNIKPDLNVHMEDIENIIVMPSVFSCRNVIFWYSGNTFLFYIALDSKKMTMEEPSDMLLLRTLAFNDRTRLKMLKTLSESALSVNDIAERLDVNASTASRHFKVFKDVALVDIQSQEGNSVYYRLNEKEISKALKSIYDYILKGDTDDTKD